MNERRGQFTFYSSFQDAAKYIRNKSERCDFYESIINFGLTGIEPDANSLSEKVMLAFALARPNLDSSRKKARSGHLGGSAERQSKEEANGKQRESKKEKEKEDEIEKENENEKEKETEIETEKETEGEREKKPERESCLSFPIAPSAAPVFHSGAENAGISVSPQCSPGTAGRGKSPPDSLSF